MSVIATELSYSAISCEADPSSLHVKVKLGTEIMVDFRTKI